MSLTARDLGLFAIMFAVLAMVAMFQSPQLAVTILNMSLISAIMALGVNMQWGYAGLFNVGIMGFTAVGGLAVVLIAQPPIPEAWSAGGLGIMLGLMLGVATILAAVVVYKRMAPSKMRGLAIFAVLVVGYLVTSYVFGPAKQAVQAVNPASEGYLGGAGLPVILAWPVGAVFAAGVAWLVGKVSLGLRSDYLAIATLGISEIVIAVLKHERWLARGVNNVTGIERPVARPIELQPLPWVQSLAETLGWSVSQTASVVSGLGYSALFLIVLAILIWLAERALNSPWGRMMRAIRDNEISARAMGKDVTRRHLMIFVLGSAVCGLAGAMMVSMDGQLTPGSYEPLRFTFLIWVMVIVGGSGNNWGAVLGAFVIWFLWVQVEPAGRWFMEIVTSGMADGSDLKQHLLGSAAYMRLLTMGIALLLMLRFAPRGLIPER
ncbi:branched-chain amino acid ABC transporter permease [Roseinatronobacter bogoriensis]|uniref:Branched-chain amino acid ABC transporter permease n=1 Tax=Roseinatronobacter bogoriensis subsp. barguzinensis TaxID=441209 RepID=A0A2K8KE90_9RHOB|nr:MULTISPECIES: branched-chain amino acid ABC transporter permease [Rhodobaca]ATX66253.1 branched-chain amino acid ABC transporter permease [Rhodobaca barguzinensis]MBB4207372.1 branched-chain amino acid transport system permease protein [Rhodobaca bogoriensis DSM 18756]TDW40321.1 amino acid/amide ABC transporter membrane protein 2 (HAAT family) [Rhodobaca barguzinensis]TDY70527.1 amino acid/amide ABC transporter membrane protein 2 (HAAT family) [Rhodobaca bogoriensis DSM 18756]